MITVTLPIVAGLVLLAALLPTLAAYLSQRNEASRIFDDSRGNIKFTKTYHLQPRILTTFGNADNPISLLFVLNDFDSNAGEISGTVSTTVDRTKFKDQNPGATPPETITLTLTSLFTSTEVAIPLRQATGAVLPQGIPITLEAWGERHAFPADSYAASYFISIGSGLGYPNVSVIAASGLSDFNIDAHGYSGGMNLLLSHGLLRQAWIYLLALSPAILLMALVYSAYRRHPNANDIAIQAAVGLLALLPIRQVLVPSALEGITEVDIILGAEFLAFITWVSYVVLHSERWTSSQAPTNDQGL